MADKPPRSRDEAKQALDDFSSVVFPIIKATALSELTGGLYVMELVPIKDRKGEVIDTKYVKIPHDDTEKIEEAVNYILANGNNLEADSPYFILGQREPSHKFWESLVARWAGKPVEEVKIEQSIHHHTDALKRIRDVYSSAPKKQLTESSIESWL